MPDNSAALAEYSRHRHAAATARATTVLQQLEARGGVVTYASVAAAAQVSRAWLYTQPTLRASIDELRAHARPTQHDVPARQRASDLSLRQRLEAAHLRNRRLDAEVAALRQQLAAAHGELRLLHSARPVQSAT